MPLPPKRRTARSIREARGSITSRILGTRAEGPIVKMPSLYLLERTPLPSTMHSYLRQIIQTPESALIHIKTISLNSSMMALSGLMNSGSGKLR
jgi:hypothetical protein